MNLLVDPNETIDIDFYVARNTKGDFTVASTEEELINAVGPAEKHLFIFRQPTLRSDTKIVDSALVVIDGQVSLKPSLVRYNRLVALLKSWTIKDKDGEIIPVRESTIGDLKPIIAEFVSNKLEQALGLV